MPSRISVLFVCMGNICRSPLAEGVFLHKINQRGMADRFRVESAGTGGWHAGSRPDPGSVRIAGKHGIVLPSRARVVEPSDFDAFDHILCMDRINERHLLAQGAPREKLRLLLSLDPRADRDEVPDPYGEGADAFELVYHLVDSACDVLLDELAGPSEASPS